MKKTIDEFDLKNKRVIIRVDFNVPMKDGKIIDDTRIKESLKTINYAIDNDAKVILLSHLGRIKEESDLEKNSLKPVSVRLSELLNKEVVFIDETRGEKLEQAINKMKNKDVLLVQNTRYEDLNGKLESNNDEKLGQYWASLGDIFINDAFGTSHRNHASNVGIAKHLPNGIGFLIAKEINAFKPILVNPARPFTIILGGAKVKDKIGLIKNLIDKVDYLLIGGGMSLTFLKASGINVGTSLVDEENIEFAKKLLEQYPNKIILPTDVVVALSPSDTNPKTCFISDIKNNEMVLDIGNLTIKLFKQYLDESKLIFWNGTMGMNEIPQFSIGTNKLCEVISNLKATKIVGGGDTAAAVINGGYKDKFDHVSTGGGASLELLEGNKFETLGDLYE